MHLLVADRLPQTHLAELEARGHAVTYRPDAAADDLERVVADHEVLVVRSTRVNGEALAAGRSLRLVVRAGSGTDTIDCDAASALGIAVCNLPGRNAVAVAELAFALLLAIDRRLVEQVTDLRAGHWRKKEYQDARGIAGRKVGIVGLGDIGLAFAARAVAFGCEVVGLTRTDRPAEAVRRAEAIGIVWAGDLDELAHTCDTLSFHVPLSDATRGLIGRELLAHVQHGATIINTSRGELIDEDALLEALDTKDLRVGLDVYPGEPATGEGDIDCRLVQHPNVIGTHHVGASTEQAQHAVADGVVELVDAFAGGRLISCVNQRELAGVVG